MDIAERLFNWFVASTLMASAVAVVVLAVQHLLRRRIHARLRYALWLIVLLRLMLPVLPQSPVSLFNAVPAWTDIKNAVLGVSYQWNKPDAISEHSQIENTYKPYYTTNEAEKNTVLQPLLTTDTEEHITAGIEGESHPAVRVLAVVWLTGAAVLLGYNLIYWLRFQNKIKRLSPVDRASILKIAEESRSLFSMKRPVGIYVDPSAQSPYITGIFRPAVYLPKSLVSETVNEQLLKHVIVHELAHYKRKDTIWNMVGSLVFAVHWMNPIVWLVLRQIKADRELACDALVLEKLGEEEAVPYGMTIIEFLRRYASGRSPAHLLYFRGSNGQREMMRRIRMIQSFKKGSYKFSMLAVILVLLFGTATLTNARESEAAPFAVAAQEQQQSGKTVKVDKTVAAKLQQVVNEFAGKEIKLKDVFKLAMGDYQTVESVDGKYALEFGLEKGAVLSVSGPVPIDKISKEDQEKILQYLKKIYPNKTYTFENEMKMLKEIGSFERISYTLKGKDFWIVLSNQKQLKDLLGLPELKPENYEIKTDAKELDKKMLKTASEAVKMVLNQDFNATEAILRSGQFDSQGDMLSKWQLKGNGISVGMEGEPSRVSAVGYDSKRVEKEKVKTNKEIPEKEARKVIAAVAKELYNIDISGYKMGWDNDFKFYTLEKDIENNKTTIITAELDANKNMMNIFSYERLQLNR
ncbi:M56 family metallopeptidase [Paenibacillus lautus]|uniref:M56 family metallopeptidase n=1 Tax=Paenibacillus lautus TaxID=1401 RepID=UPI003D269C00